MRRTVIALCLVLSGCTMTLAHPAYSQDIRGTVLLPSDNSPGTARIAYAISGSNGVLGYVFKLTVGAPARFTLKMLDPQPTLNQFSITFYGGMALFDPSNPGQTDWITGTTPSATYCDNIVPLCTDNIPSGATWAIITLTTGATGNFQYTATG